MNNFTLRVNISSYLLIIFFSIFYVQSSIAHSCVPAVIDGVTSSGNNICPGEPVTLTVDGYLWDVKEWRWYDGDCSSAATIVGVGPSITVNPSSTTTYFVAGIGGCIGEDPSLYYIGCQGITIFVTAPEISGCPASQDVSVNENCEFILPNYLNNITVTDNCGGTPTLTQSPPVGFVMDPNTPSGSTTVTITATDGSGNTSSCTFSLTAIDDTAPSISCPGTQNIPLDASCLSSHNNYIGLAIFSDNCGSVAVSQDPPEGTLITENTTATLTATDASGNTSSCTFVVNVVDQNAPSAICQNLTVQLDAGGEAIITAYDVDSGSSDNCGIASLAISQSSFNCTNIGVNSVVLTVTDAGGNQAVCTATVTVADDINPCCEAPVITCPDNITINCTGSSEPSNTGQATSTGGCGLVNLTPTDVETPGNCTGNYTISRTWTATDEEQNTATCVQTITVQDNTAPSAICQDITVQLDASGSVSITADDVDNGSNDACGIVSLSVSPNSFTCDDLGSHTVTLTVTDDCDKVSSCTATVTVQDAINPCIACDEYVILSEENMEIEETTIHSGGIGVLNEDEEAKIDDNSLVIAAGTFVKAPEVDVKDGSQVNVIIEEQADPNCMPEFLYNNTSSNNDVTVDEDETVILDEAIYDDIEVEDGATVIFSGHADVYIEDFETHDNVTVIFDQCTRLHIENEFRLGEETDFNTDNENVAVFSEDKIAFEGRNTVFGLFYTLEEVIVHKAKSYDRNQLHGQFIGREVDAEKYTDFYYQPYMPCDLPFIPLLSPEQEDIIAQEELQTRDNQSSNLSKLAVAPNPFRAETNISFNLDQEDQVVLEIYNLNGQMINQLHSGMLSSGTHKLSWNGNSRDGNQLESGIYFVILKTNEQVITKKVSLIK